MQAFTYTVQDPVGLHARPAGLLVKCAQSCGSEVTMEANGKTANAKRLFAVLGLGVKKGDPVAFTIQGAGEEEDLRKMADFCKANI